MDVRYSTRKTFDPGQLGQLFLSVEWDSGNHPQRLARALAESSHVFSAWNDENPAEPQLIGLISAISDNHMVAYVSYMVVRPDFQGKGIGRELLGRMLQTCGHLMRVSLIAYDHAVPFYERCGMTRGVGKRPMFVTSLAT